MIERSFGAPNITKDGVTVAKEIILEDKLDITSGDADGLIMAQAEQMRARYYQGFDPKSTAYYDFGVDFGKGVYVHKKPVLKKWVNGEWVEEQYAKGGELSEEQRILKVVDGGSVFSQELTSKWEIVKENFKTFKDEDAEQKAKDRKKELIAQGYTAKMKRYDFEDLARGSMYSITAIKAK